MATNGVSAANPAGSEAAAAGAAAAALVRAAEDAAQNEAHFVVEQAVLKAQLLGDAGFSV